MEKNIQMAIAVTLSRAVTLFWDERSAYDYVGQAVPESLEDGWEKLMRVRDHAENDLAKW